MLGQTCGGRGYGDRLRPCFNGGPSNCSAKPVIPLSEALHFRTASMEGRAIARPNIGLAAAEAVARIASMEGRAIARPNPEPGGRSPLASVSRFNGGPSNCSAKRARLHKLLDRPDNASMEGRAIARPNLSTPDVYGVPCIRASMEGRAIARPNGRARRRHCSREEASMEGRAIARPNMGRGAGSVEQQLALQWRAEQLLGQTRKLVSRVIRLCSCFNGGPSNCSAKRTAYAGAWALVTKLQWRAEQLLGQTRSPKTAPRWSPSGFNGGPSNCSAKRCADAPIPADRHRASMEGRAIARPNDGSHSWPSLPKQLQWRAEQLLGQTRLALDGVGQRPLRFNGGPSNCSAKPSTTDAGPRAARRGFNGGPSNCSAKPAPSP